MVRSSMMYHFLSNNSLISFCYRYVFFGSVVTCKYILQLIVKFLSPFPSTHKYSFYYSSLLCFYVGWEEKYIKVNICLSSYFTYLFMVFKVFRTRNTRINYRHYSDS